MAGAWKWKATSRGARSIHRMSRSGLGGQKSTSVLSLILFFNYQTWDLMPRQLPLRHLFTHSSFWRFQQCIHLNLSVLRNLSLLRPPPHPIEISTPVLRAEIHERHRLLHLRRFIPNLSEYAQVGDTHETLSKGIKAVRDVQADDVVWIREGGEGERGVMRVVPMEGFAERVLGV